MVLTNFYFKKTILLWGSLALAATLIILFFVFSVKSADAKVYTPSNKASVSQSAFRAYNSSTTATPGSPLASSNQAATLGANGDPFRLRLGVTNTDEPYVPLTIKQVAATSYYTCALASDDWVYCWSDNTEGDLGTGRSSWDISAPTPISRGDIPAGETIKSVAAASNGGYVCTIASDDWVYCWGSGDDGPDRPTSISRGAIPPGVTIRSVSLGDEHTCVVASNDKAYCWGGNGYGQLGNNTTSDSWDIPVAVSNGAIPSPYTVKAISAGGSSTCAIASNDKAYCWGANWDGRLATGNNTDSSVPAAMARGAMPNNFTIKDISVGVFSVCVIANNDNGYCAGYNTGQLGSTPTSDSNTMRAIAQGQMPSLTIKKIVMAANHACAIGSNDKMYCWGANDWGQLGNNSTADSKTPVTVSQGQMPSGFSISSIAVAYNHTCATVASDTWAYCWGYNYDGRVGDGTHDTAKTPRRVLAGAISYGLRASSVQMAWSNTCALADDNWLYCWGYDDDGQLGVGGSVGAHKNLPTRIDRGDIASGLTIKSFAVADSTACVIASDGSGYCWGLGYAGQLANLDEVTYTSPSKIVRGEMPSGFSLKAISTHGLTTCMIANDDWVYCAGDNINGNRGVGYTGGGNSEPEKVVRGAMPSGSTIKQVSVGDTSSCVIASNDWVYCWGYNKYGELGNNSTSTSSSPVSVSRGAIPSGATIKQVSVYDETACAVASDDWVYCWGYNGDRNLGDGTTTTRRTPVKVTRGDIPSGATIKSVSVGFRYTCATASDGNAYCWGVDENGQTGWDGVGDALAPRLVVRGDLPEGATVKQISAGRVNSCSIDSTSRVYCWGYNDEVGELGNGSVVNSSVPARVATGEYNPDKTISSGALSLKIQFAPKAAAPTCSAVSSGWADVTSSSAIAFGSAPPANGAAISSFADDPAAPSAGGFAYQTIVRSGTSFTNSSSIAPQQTGLWDFVLADRTGTSDTSYCLRIIPTNSNSSIDAYDVYPEIKTALGSLDVSFVDSSGNSLTGSARDVSFPSQKVSASPQDSTAKLVDVSSKQLDIHNSLNSGWSVSLAVNSPSWQDNNNSNNTYDYKGSSQTGRLSVDFTYAAMAGSGTGGDGSSCNTNGLTLPSGSSSYSSSVSSIVLLSGSSSSQFGCHWRLRDVYLNQSIPAYQPAGDYRLDMTVTAVAQ